MFKDIAAQGHDTLCRDGVVFQIDEKGVMVHCIHLKLGKHTLKAEDVGKRWCDSKGTKMENYAGRFSLDPK